MANNYCLGSDILRIPAGKHAKARKILARIEQEFEEEDDLYGYLPLCMDLIEEGVWFHHDESIDADATAAIAKMLVEELEIDEPFVMEFAFECSKPRCGEFGGCAFRVQRGKETKWLNTGDLRNV